VPFYLHLTPYVPHAPATPPDRYLNDFPDAMAPRTPSFNEDDVSDKPAWLAGKPKLTKMQRDAIDDLYKRRLRSMEAIQDLVQNVVDTLGQTGQLANTYIVFSDLASGPVMAQLSALLHNMHGCQGQACRDAEQMTPPP
jgi:N-acetylglucosamine-6-sulfatase